MLSCTALYAGVLSGIITDKNGVPLAYASVMVKGTTKGTTANKQGKYVLELETGSYTIICQYVDYVRQEKSVVVGKEAVTASFSLEQSETSMKEVIVKSGVKILPMKLSETLSKKGRNTWRHWILLPVKPITKHQ